jgi:hypothetical protein
MDNDKLFEELLQLLEKLSIQVRYDRGNFRGGLVKYHDADIFYINRKSDVDVKINTIINELKNIEIPEELISGEIRDLLESEQESNG